MPDCPRNQPFPLPPSEPGLTCTLEGTQPSPTLGSRITLPYRHCAHCGDPFCPRNYPEHPNYHVIKVTTHTYSLTRYTTANAAEGESIYLYRLHFPGPNIVKVVRKVGMVVKAKVRRGIGKAMEDIRRRNGKGRGGFTWQWKWKASRLLRKTAKKGVVTPITPVHLPPWGTEQEGRDMEVLEGEDEDGEEAEDSDGLEGEEEVRLFEFI